MTSSSRASTMSRAGRSARDSSPTRCISVARRVSPGTCTQRGSSGTSRAASGEPNTQWPTSMRASTGPSGSPTRAPPGMGAMGVSTTSPSRGGSRSRLHVAKLDAAGISTKSPWRSSSVSLPDAASMVSRQLPCSSTT